MPLSKSETTEEEVNEIIKTLRRLQLTKDHTEINQNRIEMLIKKLEDISIYATYKDTRGALIFGEIMHDKGFNNDVSAMLDFVSSNPEFIPICLEWRLNLKELGEKYPGHKDKLIDIFLSDDITVRKNLSEGGFLTTIANIYPEQVDKVISYFKSHIDLAKTSLDSGDELVKIGNASNRQVQGEIIAFVLSKESIAENCFSQAYYLVEVGKAFPKHAKLIIEYVLEHSEIAKTCLNNKSYHNKLHETFPEQWDKISAHIEQQRQPKRQRMP